MLGFGLCLRRVCVHGLVVKIPFGLFLLLVGDIKEEAALFIFSCQRVLRPRSFEALFMMVLWLWSGAPGLDTIVRFMTFGHGFCLGCGRGMAYPLKRSWHGL